MRPLFVTLAAAGFLAACSTASPEPETCFVGHPCQRTDGGATGTYDASGARDAALAPDAPEDALVTDDGSGGSCRYDQSPPLTPGTNCAPPSYAFCGDCPSTPYFYQCDTGRPDVAGCKGTKASAMAFCCAELACVRHDRDDGLCAGSPGGTRAWACPTVAGGASPVAGCVPYGSADAGANLPVLYCCP